LEAYLEAEPVREARELVADLCRHFYAQGGVTGTGGSITVKVNDPAVPLADRLIVMSPSGNQRFTCSPFCGLGGRVSPVRRIAA
jgi:methylthioribulose 1-phosphate dehydratase/enolase-phosphatase E1